MENKNFKTTSFYLAAFLIGKRLNLINILKSPNSKKSEFVFCDSPERESLVESFNFAKDDDPAVMIDARKFIASIKNAKDKLYL